MARQISIREEYLTHCDEATLQAVVHALSKEFLLIPLDNFCIEVSEQDYAAIHNTLNEFKRNAELDSQS